ncbi:MAG: hypothetical protein ACR2NL_01615 [Acidimicrobiia bacterium]
MKTLAAVLVAALSVGILADPVDALSCAQPDPIDWSSRLPASDAALIAVVESVEETGSETVYGELAIRVRVAELLHGRAPGILEFTRNHLNPWGPFYEVGQEVAIVIEDGVVNDGQMNLCGPWYQPDELRQAASAFGTPAPPQVTVYDLVVRLLERFLQSLLGWYR